MSSIRRNLLLALLGAMLLVLLLGAAATYRAEVQQAEVLLDYQLRQTALALRDQAFGVIAPPVLQSGEQDFDYSIQVWSEDGVTIYYSYPPHVFPNRAQLGFSTLQTGEGPWRVFAMQGRREIIQVAQPVTRRDQLAAHAALQSLRPFLLLFPLMGVVIWIVVGRGLVPIARLARAIGARTPSAMQPVSEDVPEEIQPLARALNDLLRKLQAALQAQRQLVADAAHELRTPLAALLLQTQLVERATNDEQRVAALAELKLGLERATRVMQQLLTLAREEPGAVRAPFAPVRLDELLPSVITQFRAIAADRDIALTFTHAAPQTQTQATGPAMDGAVMGDEASLRTLFANLLDNALRYTPAQGAVSVSLQQQTRQRIVTIEDSGPGIPAAERQRVFDRFYRRPGADQPGTGAPGTGLGLAIVQAIADRHGLKLSLGASAAGGLRVTIEFGS
jgi:two-component system OmpR family sensor kinase